MIEELAELGDVRRAAERLGVTPAEIAERIAPGLKGYAEAVLASEDRASFLVRRVRDACKALA